MSKDKPQDPQLQFPCDMHIKAMGSAEVDLENIVLEIAQKHFPDVGSEHTSLNESKGGKYVSVTLALNIESRQKLDSIYTDLQACVHISIVL